MFGQVMVNGVNVNPPLLTTSDLQRTFGSWAVRDAEFTFLDEIEVFKPSCKSQVHHHIAGMRVVLYFGVDGGEPGPGKLWQPSQLRAEKGAVGGRRPSRRTCP